MPHSSAYYSWLTTGLMLLTWVACIGQRPIYIFEKMGISGALPDAHFVFQDSEDLIWIATFEGLYSFNASSYQSFRYNPLDTNSLSGNSISCLDEDNRHRLWVGTLGFGLNLSDERKQAFSPVHPANYPDSLSFTDITGITQDDSGFIWVASVYGIALLEERNETFYLVDPDTVYPGCPPDTMLQSSRIYKDDRHRLWICNARGLHRFDMDKRQWKTPADFNLPRDSTAYFVRQDANGTIWISVAGECRMYHFDETAGLFQPRQDIPFKSQRSIVRFCFDADNRLWASEFQHSLIGYDLAKRELFLDSRVNSNTKYLRFWRHPFADNTGNIWVCSDGVFKYAYPKGFQTFITPSGYDNSVSVIHKTESSFFIGLREEGLVEVDLESNETRISSVAGGDYEGLFSNLIYSLESIDANTLVVGEFGAIQVYQNRDLVASHRAAGAIRDLYTDRNGNVWASSFAGLYSLGKDGKSIKLHAPENSEGRGGLFFQTIVEDNKGNLWIATEHRGLLRYNIALDSFTQFSPVSADIKLPSWRILDLAADLSGTLWIGTNVGLVSLDPETMEVHHYDSDNSLANDFIASIEVDKSGRVWTSTNVGISCYDPRQDTFTNYTHQDGLNNSYYYPRARFQADDGSLYFGGRNGVDFFNPEDIRPNPFPPVVKIISVEAPPDISFAPIAGEVAEGMDLPYNTDFIHVTFSGLHYSAPDAITFEYKLEGLSDKWTALGAERDLVLAGLGPGHYSLNIRATSLDNVVSEKALEFPITINPPFWRTLWFQLIVLGLILTSLFFGIRYRESLITLKEQQRSEVQQQILDLEKKALLAQMNPHFIFNAMNSIQQYIFTGDNEGAMKYLTKFSRLLRNVLQGSSEQLIPLANEIQLIKDYIELEMMRFTGRFDYEINVDRGIDINSLEIPPFLIQPQVENSILHGLLNKDGNGHIRISISSAGPDTLSVVVEDNGIGRKRAEEMQLTNKFQHTGRATNIVRKRLMHNKLINGSVPYKIVDLEENGMPAGTRVEMIIPKH